MFARFSMLCAGVAAGLGASSLSAQRPSPEAELRAPIDSLFSAMQRTDTAAVRAAFLTIGRVTPIPADAAAEPSSALTVDAFVAFAARNAPGAWVERIKNPKAQLDGTLGSLWYDYEVARGGAVTQCGVQSVQLKRTAAGWKILSMTFTSRSDCARAHL